MDNDTYDDRHSRQQKFNENIVKRLEELEDKIPIIIQRIIGTEDFLLEQKEYIETAAVEANARFDIGIENRTKAFNKIDQIEEDLDIIDITLERHADILVVHRNELDNKGKHGKEEWRTM